jgi:hypothetical protein
VISLEQPLLSVADGRIDSEDYEDEEYEGEEDEDDEEDDDGGAQEASYFPTPASINPDSSLGSRRGQDGSWEENASSLEQPLLPAADIRINDDDDADSDDADGGGGDIAPINVFPAWMEDSQPVIKIYNLKASPKDIERFREEAAEIGIPAGMMRNPAKLEREAETQSSGAYAPPTNNSLLLVTSRDPEPVKLVVDSQKYKMPGTPDDPPFRKESLQTRIKSVTNLQLVLTGLVAGGIGGGL